MMDMAGQENLLVRLRGILGTDGLLVDEAARQVYARDASHLTLGRPLAVALPATEAEAAAVLAACSEAGIPVVCRGTGTGLSGGAVPPEGAVVLATSRLDRIGPVVARANRVRCEPGVLNSRVTLHASAHGLHFAPDPSSQSTATIGGNIAENAGGPHCLRHGVTLQHLHGLQWCDARGRRLATGRHLPAERGFDLTSLLCGSEGTLGLVTAAELALVPDPAEVATLLAFFPVLDDATAAVVELLGAGLLPVAVEIVDQAMLLAVEEAFAFGFPTDVEAAMICEFAGSPEDVAEDGARAEALLTAGGARRVHLAADADERLELWKCRKKAFGAVGRLAPSYVTMDVVVPLAELPPLVRRIQAIKAMHGVEIATAFHAGDGNLHPGVHYDNRSEEDTRRAHAAADAIIRTALARGGSCTGEHGVGLEKIHVLPWQIDRETARLQQEIKMLFDPDNLLNPGKLLPPLESEFAGLPPVPRGVDFAWESLTVTAPAGTRLARIQTRARERGLWIPVGVFGDAPPGGMGGGGTVADLVNHLLPGPALLPGGSGRDFLLELWAATGDGRPFHCGAPVFKNVAGYDLTRALCGSAGRFVRPLAATFQLRPAPETAAMFRFETDFEAPGFEAGLAGLLSFLDRVASGTAGSSCILDQVTGTITVAIAGRDRDWDLGRWPGCLAGIWPDLELRQKRQVPFSRSSDLLTGDLLPAWVLNSPRWSFQAPLPGRGDETVAPAGKTRLIWQGKPRLWWVPDHESPAAGWHSEPFLATGEFSPLSEPDSAVPRDFLRGLKRIFDPRNELGGPDWLIGGRHGD